MSWGNLCDHLHVISTTLSTPSVGDTSRIVDAQGYNTARFGLVVFFTGADLRVKVQGSDDRENWHDLATLGTAFPVGFSLPAAVTGMKVAYLRVNFLLDVGEPGPTALVAVTYNLENL